MVSLTEAVAFMNLAERSDIDNNYDDAIFYLLQSDEGLWTRNLPWFLILQQKLRRYVLRRGTRRSYCTGQRNRVGRANTLKDEK